MTKSRLILFFILFQTLIFGQHQVKLVSGDTMSGEVQQITDGVLSFKYKGSLLKIPVSEIQVIVFDDQFALPGGDEKLKAEITGVITYFFNSNFGDKPDVGARIIAIKSDSLIAEKSFIHLYQIAQSYRRILSLGIDNQEMASALIDMGCDTQEGFNKLDEQASSELMERFLVSDKVKKVTVGGTGNYSLSLDPGTYEVLIISNGRKHDSQTELYGQILWKLVTVGAGETLNLDHRFHIK